MSRMASETLFADDELPQSGPAPVTKESYKARLALHDAKYLDTQNEPACRAWAQYYRHFGLRWHAAEISKRIGTNRGWSVPTIWPGEFDRAWKE